MVPSVNDTQLGASYQIPDAGWYIVAACPQGRSFGMAYMLFVTAAQRVGAFLLSPSGNDYKKRQRGRDNVCLRLFRWDRRFSTVCLSLVKGNIVGIATL